MTGKFRSVLISLFLAVVLALNAGCVPITFPGQNPPTTVVTAPGATTVNPHPTGAVTPTATGPAPTATPTPRKFSRADVEIIDEAWDEIMDNYVDKSLIDTEAMKQAAIEALMKVLNDPYSAYLNATEYKDSVSNFQGTLEGIGAQVAIKDNVPVITPFPDTPATRAGLKAGDQILQVNGVSTASLSVQEVVSKIRGPAGTAVKLLIQHPGEPQPVEVSVTRAKINIPSVTFEMVGDIAHIRLLQFTDQTDVELTKFLQSMPSTTTGIILDQRNNPGGIVDTVVAVASHFIKSGTIVDLVDNKGSHRTLAVKSTSVFTNLPVVVLVNEFSASGAELLSGALQDYGRATIAGTKTFGKGSYDNLFQLKDGSGLYLTTGRWLTPKGRAIEGKGIQPDIPVDFTKVDGTQWAIDYLKSSKAPTPP